MPRAIVFIKGKNWNLVQKKLANIFIKHDRNFVKRFCTVLEFYTEAFGNPDFIACLWAPNIELIKSSILYLREICDADTTSIIGSDPHEREIREKELQKENPKTFDDRIKQIIEAYVAREKERLENLENVFKD